MVHSLCSKIGAAAEVDECGVALVMSGSGEVHTSTVCWQYLMLAAQGISGGAAKASVHYRGQLPKGTR